MPSSFEVDVPTPAEWDVLVTQTRKAQERAVELTAQEVWGNVAKEAPVDEGLLAGSFKIEQVDGLTWRIYTNVEYAEAVHEGTKPRVIRAKGGGYLAFMVGKTLIIRRSVNHPGTAANPYADRAIDTARSRTDEFIRRAVSETVKAA